MQPGVVTDGCVLELHAARANAGMHPGMNFRPTSVWEDTSCNGHDGTLNGFAYTAASGWGSDPPRLVFAGDNDYVITGASSDFLLTDITLEVWCVPAAGTGQQALIEVGNGAAASGACLYLRHTAGGDIGLSSHDDDATRRYTYGGTVSYGNLAHIVGIHDAATLRIHYNGSLAFNGGGNTQAYSRYASPQARIGYISNISPGYLNGSVLAARIYNRALTPAEVAQNLAAGPYWPGPPMSLVQTLAANETRDFYRGLSSPYRSEAPDNLLRYTSGAGVAGSIYVEGWEEGA